MATCYLNNGATSAALGPCNVTEGVSLCCATGDNCLTNGLCATSTGVIYQGGCTDSTYKATICPKFCVAEALYIVTCEGSAVRNGDYCCNTDYSTTCCNDAAKGLGLAPSASSAKVVIAPSAPTPNMSTTSSSSPVMSISLADPSISSTALLATLLTSTTSVTRTQSILASPIPAENGNWAHQHRVPLGVGFGVGLPMLAVIFCGWRWVCHQKVRHGSGDRVYTVYNWLHCCNQARRRSQPLQQRSGSSTKSESTLAGSKHVDSSELHGDSTELHEFSPAAPSTLNNGCRRGPSEPQTQPLEIGTDADAPIHISEGPPRGQRTLPIPDIDGISEDMAGIMATNQTEYEDFVAGAPDSVADPQGNTPVQETFQSRFSLASSVGDEVVGVDARGESKTAGSQPKEGESEGGKVQDGPKEGGPNPNEVKETAAIGV
ncbi:hypothetical protein N7G274_002527 [Stereocaulon virgatum]|uniref:Uncharacterized protein n=1 Tax=Stereocaulon virgatum TaxID=373712 RepID=A0ABR4AFZ9_9LECA